jgi:hypothetical protein
MNLRPILASIFLTTCFAGCATFTDAELGQVRQHGVSPAVVGKMQDGRVLSPGDVIELTRRGVSDVFIIRQIEDVGVDYVLHRNDFKRLQEARVSGPVMDALIAASDDFASRNTPEGRGRAYAADPGYPYDNYYGPYPYAYPYAYGGVTVEVGGGRYCDGRYHHWH